MVDLDTIVIGSGAGGLTAALALAQAGQKVLVLEQHYLPGGWCHSFNLGEYRFSPGVHYIGELNKGAHGRLIFEGLGLSEDLIFHELNPNGYDHIIIGQDKFSMPKGRAALTERLIQKFPEERQGIKDYFEAVVKLRREMDSLMQMNGLQDLLLLPWKAPHVARWGLSTTRRFIDHFVKNPHLRAILAGQSGDHGLPPRLAPVPMHVSIVSHYLNGGYYPEGGGAALPKAFIRALKRAGGDIRVRSGVEQIIIENNRAVGVRLKTGEELRARHIVSNADPHATFAQMIAPEHLNWRLRRKLSKTRYSISALSLFMAANIDAQADGLDSGNYWLYANNDIDAAYEQGMRPWKVGEEKILGTFLTLTTLKDPSKNYGPNRHTMESFAFIHHDAFKKWALTSHENRPPEYNDLKSKYQEEMLLTLENIVPGLREKIVFAELGTPLTNNFYCAATAGNLYGIEKSASQIGPWSYPIETMIPGLWMCGASTVSHGVMGAMMSGLLAAGKILGVPSTQLLRQRGPSLKIVSKPASKTSGAIDERQNASTAV